MIRSYTIDGEMYWIPDAWMEFTIAGRRYRRNFIGAIMLDLLPPPAV